MTNNLIVKANDLIEARYNLNLNEQKIILYAVSKIETQLSNFNIITLNVKEFTDLIGTTTERYSEIREIVRELRKKEVIINTNERELITGWLSSIDYIKDSGEIKLEFSNNLVPYLLELKARFTRYELKNILYLKNKHSIRIYELVKQYEKIGKRIIDVEELKKCLMLEDKYKVFKDFERWVLKVSVQEINLSTDLHIYYTKNKKGRKIDSITFTIESKKDNSYIEFLDKTYNIKEFREKSGIENENFDSKQVLELYEVAVDMLIDDYESEDDLFEYIRLNYVFMKEKKGVKNPFTYLKRALKEDYAVARAQIKLNYKI